MPRTEANDNSFSLLTDPPQFFSRLPSMAFVSRNWPPRCLELVAPNSTVLDQAALDHVTQAGV